MIRAGLQSALRPIAGSVLQAFAGGIHADIDRATALLHSLGAVRLIDGAYINPAISANRAGPGMVQNAAGEWVWQAHNIADFGSSSDDGLWDLTIAGRIKRWTRTGTGTGSEGWGLQMLRSSSDTPVGSPTAGVLRYRCSAGFGISGNLIGLQDVGGGYTQYSFLPICDEQWHSISGHHVQGAEAANVRWFSGVPHAREWIEVDFDQSGLARGSDPAKIFFPTGSVAKFPPRITQYPEPGLMCYGQTTNLCDTIDLTQFDGFPFMTAQYAGMLGDLPYYKISYTGGFDPQLRHLDDAGGSLAGRTLTSSWILWTDPGQPTEAEIFIYNASVNDIGNKIVILTDTPTRHSCSRTFVSTDTSVTTRVDGPNALGQAGYFYACMPQTQEGARALPPIPTYGAAATCAADIAIVPLAATRLTDAQGAILSRSVTYAPSPAAVVFGVGRNTGYSANGETTIWDGANYAHSPNAAIGAVKTSVTSFGPAGLTAIQQGGAESTASYGGAFVDSTDSTEWIGSLSGANQFLHGTISKLYTIPSQPIAAIRAKLAALWGSA